MTRTQTSTGWLQVARWLALAGVIGAVVWGFFSYQLLQDRLDALSRTTVPGQVTVEALETEGLTIYYEDPTAPGRFLVRASASNTLVSAPVGLAVTGPSGAAVPTAPYERDLRFRHDGRDIIALATVDLPAAGTYVIQASGSVPPTAMVSAGQVIDFPLIANAAGAVTLFLGSLVVVLATSVVGAFTRSRARSFEDAGRTPTHQTGWTPTPDDADPAPNRRPCRGTLARCWGPARHPQTCSAA
jgi:hypothetical protein